MSKQEHERARASLVREEGFRFSVRFGRDGVPALVTDERPPLGAGTGPDPSELLAAAVGNCLASSLLFCLQKARLEVAGLAGEVWTTTVRNPQGRLRLGGIQVRLSPSVGPGVREAMSRCLEVFESFCIVTESVRQGIPISVTVEAREAAAGATGGATHGAGTDALAGTA